LWAGIEQAIGKKKDRRRMLWFFILPALLIPVLFMWGNLQKQGTPAPATHANTSFGNKPLASIPAEENRIENNTIPQNDFPVGVTGNIVNTNDFPSVDPPISNKSPRIQWVTGSAKKNRPYTPSKNNTSFTPNKMNVRNDDHIPKGLTIDGTDDIDVTNDFTSTQEAAVELVNPQPANSPLQTELGIASAPQIRNIPTPAKEIVKVSLPRRKIRFGLNASAGAGYRLLQMNVSGEKALNNRLGIGVNLLPGGDVTSLKNLEEQPAGSLSVGLTVNIPLSRKWSIESGIEYQRLGYDMLAYETSGVQLNYSRLGYNINTVATDLNSRFVSSPYYASGTFISRTVLKNRYQFLKIPVVAVFEANPSEKRSVFLKAGVAGSYLLGKDAFLYSPETSRYFKTSNPEAYRNFNITGILQPGFRFRFRNNDELHLGLNVEFNLLSTHNKQLPLREHLFQAGFKITYLLR
jgi:hypothetical protein